MIPVPAKGGIEEDVFSRYWRRYLCYLDRPGIKKWAKRQYNKRVRKIGKIEADREKEGK